MHDEGGGISHEEAEGQRTRNKDERIRGTMDAGGWTVAPGAGPAKGRAKRAEQGHHRRAEDHLSTENYVKFIVLFNIADGFPCFYG